MLQRTFLQFRVLVFDPIPKNENAESGESFIRFYMTMLGYLESMLMCGRNSNFPSIKICFLKRKIRIVTSFIYLL